MTTNIEAALTFQIRHFLLDIFSLHCQHSLFKHEKRGLKIIHNCFKIIILIIF